MVSNHWVRAGVNILLGSGLLARSCRSVPRSPRRKGLRRKRVNPTHQRETYIEANSGLTMRQEGQLFFLELPQRTKSLGASKAL
jgi:hypothetical protein